MSVLDVVRYCDVAETGRVIGKRRLIKLLAGFEEERSLKPFIKTNSIFVHVPKAAGVSVARALYGNLGMGHMTLSEYRSAFRPGVFASMFKFAFVRNPFDRIHSAYHFIRKGGMSAEDAAFNDRVMRRYPTFERFVLDGLDEARGYWHFLPQTHFLGDGLDFIGRFERIEEDFELAKARIKTSVTLPHMNRTEKGDYRTAYTPEMIDRIRERYADDLSSFGYGFS